MFDYRTQSDTDANEKALSPFHFQLIFHTIQVLRELALMETAQKFTGEEERERERERERDSTFSFASVLICVRQSNEQLLNRAVRPLQAEVGRGRMTLIAS